MLGNENKLVSELHELQNNFKKTTDKLIKDINRHDKIMAQSDKRQQKEYDELQVRLKEVEALSKEIEETQREVVFTMGAIGESRSKETGNHVKRVAEYSKVFALYYGLPEKEAEMLKQASPMHDIGKVAIPDAVLNKPGSFNEEERKIMNTHSQLGYDMLKHSNRSLLKCAATVAYEHHEKWDGTGYPRKLKGEEIHIYGRITAMADVFDALGSDRCYKEAWDDEKIFNLFKEERGKHFEPKLVDIFFEHLDEFLEIRETLKDEYEK
ncbi:HD domain-containing phosphohydrolase [Halarcobacter sp.]|uniref:HD-GYP domain-containing protein n=2 Tax=Halarcobacter sp. TaxID=2321133 RepID=UPI002AAAEE14|nr:HD domain-containing phosphohydrolase [Halarcobacter sp.]